MQKLKINVNNQEYELPFIPGEMLSDLLRDRLGLIGTKIGCNEAECGTCTVVIDGQAVLSCNYPSSRAVGKKITTIEGLAKHTKENGSEKIELHPLQEAFVKYGAVQCGFCIPGQIMTSYALLQNNPVPSADEIQYALKDTLCRCAGYPSIIGSVQAASKAITTGAEINIPNVDIAKNAGSIVGRVQLRPDSIAKVTGKAIYSDDINFPGMLHAGVKRAMLPSAVVKKIDITKASLLPGVQAVITAHDLQYELNHGLVIKDWPVLVGEGQPVRYIGDAIAIVAADSKDIADEAVKLIEVVYDKKPVVDSAVMAFQDDAPRIHENGNLLKHIKSAKRRRRKRVF